MFYETIFEYGDVRLVRRPDTPNYHLYYKPRCGGPARRTSTRTSDLEEAKAKLIQLARRRERGGPREPHELSALHVLCDYVERRMPRIRNPYNLRSALKHFTEFFEVEDIASVADLTPDMQDYYIEWRRERLLDQGFRASNGTMNRELGVLKAALRHAWKRGTLTNVRPISMLPSPPPRDEFLTPEEVQRLFAGSRHEHLRTFLILALHTAQRPCAIFDLRLDQVDMRRGLIDFLPRGSTQSKKRRPTVPMNAALRAELEIAMNRSISGYVVEWRGNGIRSVRRTFEEARERAGLPDYVTPYILRHTAATIMASEGVPMWQIAGLLGHSSTRTTEQHYAKHRPGFLREASQALETAFVEPKRLAPAPVPSASSPDRC